MTPPQVCDVLWALGSRPGCCTAPKGGSGGSDGEGGGGGWADDSARALVALLAPRAAEAAERGLLGARDVSSALVGLAKVHSHALPCDKPGFSIDRCGCATDPS